MPGESSTDWDTHRMTFMEDLAPVRAVERALVERVAWADWRWQRVTSYEMAAIEERQNLEHASDRLLPRPLDIDKIIRYGTYANREFYQALHELEAMRAERRGQPTPLLRMDVNNETGTLAASESA